MGPTHGSDQGWRQLLAEQVRQHARLWFRVAYDVLHDAHVAEDVCQQALLRAWTHRDRLRDPGLLRAWLARTVLNESLAIVRRRQVERRAMNRLAKPVGADAAADEALSTREAAMVGMESLPEPLRIVVGLRIMEGMSGNEVSELLGCSASQVSRMLHEGLEQLRRVMNDRVNDRGVEQQREDVLP